MIHGMDSAATRTFPGACIASSSERIKRAEDRVRTENNEYRAMLGGIEFGAERSWDYALDAARDAVADARKWPAYLPPNAGDGLFVVITEADALNAIDALREKT